MKKLLLLFCGLAAFCAASSAQTIPTTKTFGKVSVEECAFTDYPLDTTAAALVLWEKCDVVVDYSLSANDLRFIKKYIIRLKILKEDGLEWANGSIRYYCGKDWKETVDHLSLVTYNLENGKVVATKASKSGIIKSNYSDNVKKIAYTADAVKIGSVVEFSYELTSPQVVNIPDFYFQHSIPVNLCSYSISLPSWMAHTRMVRGAHNVELKTMREEGNNTNGIILDNSHNRDIFRAVDLPALNHEPMLMCTSQYLDSVSYEITAIMLPGMYRDFSRTWNAIAEAAYDSDLYKEMYAKTPFKDEINSICLENSGFMDRLEAIVKQVKDNVVWDGTYGLIPSNLSAIVKAGSGSSADLNALVGSALSAAGIKVNPVLVRMRSRGALVEARPEMGAFNTFILHITSPDGVDLYFDAADPSGYFNVIPVEYLIQKGFEISPVKGRYKWVDLTSLTTNTTTYLVDARFEGNELCGDMKGQYANVSSYDFKKTFRDCPDEDALYELMESMIPADLDEMVVAGLKEFGPESSMKASFSRGTDIAGNLLIVNPFIVTLMDDTAFRHEEREYPVDFYYPETVRYVFRMTIPEGYEVDRLPQNSYYKSELPSNMSIRSSSDGKTVTVQFRFENNALIAAPSSYSDVRKYWTDVCAVFNERIIFKKTE